MIKINQIENKRETIKLVNAKTGLFYKIVNTQGLYYFMVGDLIYIPYGAGWNNLSAIARNKGPFWNSKRDYDTEPNVELIEVNVEIKMEEVQ